MNDRRRRAVFRCRALGVALAAGEGTPCCGRPTPVRQQIGGRDLADHKAAVRRLLARPPVPPWDAAAADALLAELRAEVVRIVEAFGGHPPAPLVTLLSDPLAIGACCVRDHDAEASHGWILWSCCATWCRTSRASRATSLFDQKAN